MPVHHLGRVAETSRIPAKPWEAACSCNSQGQFPTKAEAVDWMNGHLRKAKHNSNITTELVVVDSPKSVVVPVKPAAPVEAVHTPALEKTVEAAATPVVTPTTSESK